jgi:hypothetical protein
MFDLSDPQKRERVLVIVACISLCVLVTLALPMMFRETTRLQNEKTRLESKIEELELHARNKDEIQSRLTTFTNQALASSGSRALDEYRNWLGDLARSAGIRDYTSPVPARTALRGAPGTKHTFTITGTGRLDQIAEFLRRFHRTEYLHLIQSVAPRPSTRTPGEFDVTIKIEALELPEARTVRVPSIVGDDTAITDEERQMLAAISERRILSAFVPPPPPAPRPTPVNPVAPPPIIDFDDSYFCFVIGIMEIDGRPQCWIDYRTEGRKYQLFEGDTFELGGVTCTIKKIEMTSKRVQIAAGGGVYAVRLGRSIGQADELCYFLTGIVDAEGRQWTQDSTGEPLCVIIYGSETEDARGNIRLIEMERYTLAEGDSFPMAEVLCTIVRIDPASNLVQIEAVGTIYDIRVGGSFSEFWED